jgi:hypothetical protein
MSEVSCKDRFDFMNQDELKQAVARAAIDHLVDGAVVGVGSGSTVALFIRELGQIRNRFKGAVSSSELSTRLLREEGIDVLPLEAVGSIPVYVDGADEIDPGLRMIKGGGGALAPPPHPRKDHRGHRGALRLHRRPIQGGAGIGRFSSAGRDHSDGRSPVDQRIWTSWCRGTLAQGLFHRQRQPDTGRSRTDD